jgi:hypothetical protein
MKAIRITLLALAGTLAAHADFSYTQTRKGGPGGADTASKHYFKGQKMAMQSSSISSIVDLDAQTITTLNHTARTYSVMKFSDLGQAMQGTNIDAKVDVKQTGQKKNINGYNAAEVVMTMAVDSPQAPQMKMTMEIDMWLSPDPPGAQEMSSFYRKNMDKLPWAAMAGGGANPGMQRAMADMQRQMAQLGGVPVLQVVKMKPSNNAQAAQMTQGMDQMRARLEEMKKAGGPQAQAAEQALARMGGMRGAGGGSLFELTTESTGFSAAPVPDSVFAIPTGYTKK